MPSLADVRDRSATTSTEAREDELVAKVGQCYMSDCTLTKGCFSQLRDIVDNTGPVNFFHLFVNPRNFGQSVENLFYLSRLFGEGICMLELNEQREPMVCTYILSIMYFALKNARYYAASA